MEKFIKIRLRDGSYITLPEWQIMYGLPKGSTKIGKYFSWTEYRFRQDIEQYGELIVDEMLMRLLDGIREERGKFTRINSFNRSEEHQLTLEGKGFKAAKFSPHVVKMGADIDTESHEETRKLAMLIDQVSKKMGIPCRFGYKSYMEDGMTFIHVDVCCYYYGKGGRLEGQAPHSAWTVEARW